jgi:hypothetical protein
MKKVLLSLSLVIAASGFVNAQDDGHGHAAVGTTNAAGTPPPAQTAPSSNLKLEDMAFKTDLHDFGTVQEGGDIKYEFEFKNNGKEPIIVSSVTASCGCTGASGSSDPVLPGKKSVIKAVYHTDGRVGAFNKAITVVSNAGAKVLTIKGTVEKAPETSVPQNKSMIKTAN